MSTSTPGPDDPRLTAFALGEANAAERQAVERVLAESAEARTEVEQTQAMARALAAEYAREHDRYVASRPVGATPTNVVPFPGGREPSWRRAAALTLKIAALLTITASLVYLTRQRSDHPPGVLAASAPSAEPTRGSTPQPLIAERRLKDQADPPQDAASASGSVNVVPAAAAPAGSSADVFLAMNAAKAVDAASPSTATSQSAGATYNGKAAALPSTRATALPGSAVAAVTTTTTARPAASPSLAERIAPFVVRIRTPAGAFFGGVLVASDGLILAATSRPENSLQPRCSVILADGRELPSVAKPSTLGPGRYWFFVEGKDLPAAPLAPAVPSVDLPLMVAAVDAQTGRTTFPTVPGVEADSARRADGDQSKKASSAIADADFAFNAAGELLLIDRAAYGRNVPQQAKAQGGAAATGKLVARPFTDDERRKLQQAAERNVLP